METLTEMTAAQQKAREQAMVFESLQGDLARLRATIPRLEKEVAAHDTSALKKILTIAADIPGAITTSGRSSYIAAGQPVRAVVLHAAQCGLDTAERKEEDAQRRLAESKADLAKVAKALREFE